MMRCFWLAGALLLPYSTAQAETFEWRPSNYEAAMLLKARRFDEASVIIERALPSCPQAATEIEAGLCRAIFLENRSEVQDHRGDAAAAEASLQAFIEARTAVLPIGHPLITNAHDYLADFYRRHGRRADEAAAWTRREALTRAAGPGQAANLVAPLFWHGQALQALGRPADAIPLYAEALPIISRMEPPGSMMRLNILLALMGTLVMSGSPDTAVATALDELSRPEASAYDLVARVQLVGWAASAAQNRAQIAAARPYVEAVAQSLGQVTNPIVAYDLLCALVVVRSGQGDAEASTAAIGRLRALVQANWEPRSDQASHILMLEAASESAAGHHDAAAARVADAIAALAPDALLRRAQHTKRWSDLLIAAGRRQDARDVLAAMLDSPQVTAGTSRDQADILAILGYALAKLHADQISGPACAESVRLADTRPGTPLRSLAPALWCQGQAMAMEERLEPAYQVTLRAWQVLWTGMTPGGMREPELRFQRDVLNQLFITARETGRLDDALGYARQQLALDRRSGLVAYVASSQSAISSVQRRMGRWDEAMATCDEALATLPDGNPETRAELLNSKGVALLATGHPADAADLFQAAAQLRRLAGPDYDFVTAESEGNLSRALDALGRPGEAGQHLDVAITLFRSQGALRRGYLTRALLRRGPLAIRAGDPALAEAALREALGLQTASDPDGPGTAETRLTLAGVLDNLARHDEAATLRQEALASVAARYGQESVPAQRVRLATPAPASGVGCQTDDTAAQDLLVACLAVQARVALAAGRIVDAAATAARAVSVAETLGDGQGIGLVGPLMLQAEAEAAAGNPAVVRGLLEHVDRLLAGDQAGRDKASKAWFLAASGRLLARAGDGDGAATALTAAVAAGMDMQNPELVTYAASALAASLVASGAGTDAIALWQRVMPLLAGSPVRRVAAEEGLGDAAASLGRHGEAARFYGEASTLSRRTDGIGSVRFRRLVAAQATALSWAGERNAASRALGLLDADHSLTASFVRSATRARLAVDAGDPVAALLHARQAVRDADAAFGAAGTAGSRARLDLAAIQVLAGERPDPADVERVAEAIRSQDPGWRTLHAVRRIGGLMAATAGDFDAADAAFAAAEALLAEHAGPRSVDTALAHAERANARLLRGDAAGADQLFRQALTMASPSGQPRNTAWARIALRAADAAERLGDHARAASLAQDAARILPRVQAVRQQWL